MRGRSFEGAWQAIIAQKLKLEADEPGVAEARAHLQFRWIEEPSLAGASLHAIGQAYSRLLPQLESGLAHTGCLVIDEGSLTSVLSAKMPLPVRAIPGQPAAYGRLDAPYVLALERNYSAEAEKNEEDTKEDEAEFQSYFKVPLEVLVESLYPMFDIVGGVVSELAGYLRQDVLWWPNLPRRMD